MDVPEDLREAWVILFTIELLCELRGFFFSATKIFFPQTPNQKLQIENRNFNGWCQNEIPSLPYNCPPI